MPLLDVFRLLGAICVFFVHAHTGYNVTTPLANYGTQWLTWFFMLSGFVLALRYGETNWSKSELSQYLVARLARILPAYVMAVLISLVVVSVGISVWGMGFFSEVSGRVPLYLFALPDVVSVGCVAQNALAHALFLQTFIGQKLCGGAFLINPPLWSAAVEMWIYLLFPWVLRWVWRIHRREVVCGCLAALMVLDALYVYALVPLAEQTVWAEVVWSVHFNPLVRLLELTVGVLLGRLWVLTSGFERTWQMTAPVAALALFSVGWGAFLWSQLHYTTAYWLSATGLPWAFLALLAMLYLSIGLGYGRGQFASWCASVSYIVYCTHWCLLELFAISGLKRFFMDYLGAWGSILMCLGFILMVSHGMAKIEKIAMPHVKRVLSRGIYVAK